jgi:uncharacterized repeat protein (TIGR02059 family)
MALAYTTGQTLWSYSNTTDNSSASTARFIDLDGDGDLDLFIGVEKAAGNQPSQVWKNDGAGNFSLHQSLPAARIVQSWLVNLDADPELELVTRSYQSPLQVWQNNGTGTFTAGATIGSGVQAADLADLDGDGDLDVLIGIFQGNYAVYKNNGAGAFTLASSPAKVSDPVALTLVDLDRDGDKDAVVVEDNAVRILANNGSGGFTQHSSFGDAFGGAALAADLTGDGHADALVSGLNGATANLILFQNNGSGALGNQLQVFSRAEAPAAFADVDGDGDLDGLGQKILLNNGSGTFTDSGVVLQDPAFMYNGSPVTGRALAAGDVDGDGDIDAAVAFYAGDWTVPLYSGAVKLYLNNAVPSSNADGSLSAGTGVNEPVGLPSTADTAAEAVDVFDFRLTDGGGSDSLAMGVSALKVHTSGTGDFSKLTWRLSGPDATHVVGSYNAGTNEITFSGLAISVAHGGNETYRISAFFNDRTGLANGQTYRLSIDGDTDATLTPGGTRMASGQAAVTNGTGSAVTVVNEAPTDLALSASSVAENTPTGTPLAIGTLSTTDANAGDSFTYSIVGGADASHFAISGSSLQFKAGTALDYEAQASYAVTVRSTDAGSLGVDKAFTVTLTNVNEAPTLATPLPDQGAQATQAFSFAFAGNAFVDVDAGTTLAYTATLDGGGALPAWLTFNPGSRSFSGTPAAGDAGTLQIRVTASDGSLSASDTFALVVTAGPSVSGIARSSGTALTNARSVDYTVTFSQPVTGVDPGDFSLTTTGTATGAVTGISGSGTTWTLTASGLSGDGTLRLDLNPSGTGIQNGSGLAITGGYTSGQVYTLDTTAPATPGIATLDSASDTGSSHSDGTTADTTPTLTGTADAGSTVTLYDTHGSTVLGSTTADGAGLWSITSTPLAAGAHTLGTKASDAAGNFSAASPGLALTIDPDSPVFASATVNGNQLVLAYTDAGTLDAANAPTPGAFAVLVGGTPHAATAVAVDAAARTATLTLTTPVAHGQAVTVAYNDPTAGDDAGALQDLAGNDAATLAATAATNTTPADPGPGTPPPTTVDGVPVTTAPGPGGATVITIPVVLPTRPDTPGSTTPQADIPLIQAPDGRPIVSVSVPAGVGLTAEGLTTSSSGAAALAELGFRIERIAGNHPGLTNAGQVFYATLSPTEPLSVQIIKPTLGAGYDGSRPLVIIGSTRPADGKQAIIIDARALPSGTVIQVDHIEFIAVVGNVRLIGGAGQNMASGDGGAQWIVLGPGDDILHGGAGNDVVGSEAGDDQVFGDEGDDIVFGGAGNDILSGGTGSDRLNGGTGFDVAIQEGQRTDYTITLEGAGIKLTHTASGVSDWLVDVEQVRFATGPSLTVAHSAAEEAGAYLFQKWTGRDLTQSEGAIIQALTGKTALEVATLFAQFFPEQSAGRTPAQLLEGMSAAGAIRVDAVRDVVVSGDAGHNTITPVLGLARSVDGGAGIDTVVIPATLAQTHIQHNANGSYTLQRLTDGAMLDVTHVERITFNDTRLALDLNGHAGEAARLVGALAGPGMLANKGLVGEVIRMLDGGASSQAIAGAGLQLLGVGTPTQVAQTLWTHVVGRAGTGDELKILTDILATGVSAAELVVMAAHLDATAARIDLVGLAAKGIEFA